MDGLVMYAPEPPLEAHDDAVHFLEVGPLGLAGLLDQGLEAPFQRHVPRPAIGTHPGTLVHNGIHELSQMLGAGTGYHLAIKAAHAPALALNGEHHQSLLLVPAPASLFLPAHEGLVHFHHALKGVLPTGAHRRHHLMLEAPAGLLAQLQLAAQLRAGHAFLAGGQVIDDPERLHQRELHLVEQRAGRG